MVQITSNFRFIMILHVNGMVYSPVYSYLCHNIAYDVVL